ncbi:hypothetical protein MLD38_032899 [Melastoma candidum]|uniref:Uncharacterized protein n=1 Tax=Melastoma candidum TaxID=119954 RepID=A0ACB9M5L6_9MYRT|nr:hypothetical protein MLD38_032899 [Melastoma candidum]
MADETTPITPSLRSGANESGVNNAGSAASQIPTPIQLPPSFFSSTLKLENGNYVIWKGQILAAIVAGGYEDFIYGTTKPPPMFLDSMSQIMNPEYRVWQRTNKSVMSFLFSSLTSEPLSQVVCCTSSYEVWESLRHRFESNSTTRVINLRIQMQQAKKEGKTMQEYLNMVKMFAD